MALDPWLENLRKISLKNPGVLIKSSLHVSVGFETIIFLVFLPFCKIFKPIELKLCFLQKYFMLSKNKLNGFFGNIFLIMTSLEKINNILQFVKEFAVEAIR